MFGAGRENEPAPDGRQLARGGSLNWYAIHTKPRQENLAETSLQREGIETFYPRLSRRKTIRRVRRVVTGPLFPSYIFARFDARITGRLVKYAGGVANIVSFGDRPAVVDVTIIDTIKAHAPDNVVVISPTDLKAGDWVEIQDGPLRGLQGIFEREFSDHDRVVILLTVLSKGARVQLHRDQLEKV